MDTTHHFERKSVSEQTIKRAHTAPHQADGVPLTCALWTACYLAEQNNLLRVALWVGCDEDVKLVLATAISQDVLESLLREGAAASDGLHFELRTRAVTEKPEDAILLAICVADAELRAFWMSRPRMPLSLCLGPRKTWGCT
jgi:hypothetical protein